MRQNFTCRFNDYITPDNRDGVILSVISQLQGYNCDPEVTVLEDNSFTVSVGIDGDLSPALVRDKLAFNYFIESVSTGDNIRRIKRMTLPTPVSSTSLNRLQEIRDGDMDNIDVANPEGIYKNLESLVMGAIKTADPTGELIPEMITGDAEGAKDLDVSSRSQIDKSDTLPDAGADVGIRVTPKPQLFAGSRTFNSKMAAGTGGDSGGASFTLNPPPHERSDARKSIPAAPQGVSVSSDSSQAAIPFNSMLSGGHDLDILGQGGLAALSEAKHDSLGLPSFNSFKRVTAEEVEDIEKSAEIPAAAGGSGLSFIGQPIVDWVTRPQTAHKVYFGLAHEHPYDEAMDDNEL